MAHQKVTIQIPADIDNIGRASLGRDIVDFIRNRTARGLDKNNREFIPYSETYKQSDAFKSFNKSDKVNLELSGDMMIELDVLSHTVGAITIGFVNGSEENDRAEYNRATRDFLGISEADLEVLVNRIRRRSEIDSTVDAATSRIARSLINQILGQFNDN